MVYGGTSHVMRNWQADADPRLMHSHCLNIRLCINGGVEDRIISMSHFYPYGQPPLAAFAEKRTHEN